VSVTLQWSGLEELRAELRRLPEELTGEASNIVEGAANAAAADAKQGYGKHRVTGHLQDGVIVTHFDKGRFSAGAIVKNTAKHAWIFENGTQARHYITVNGKRHVTGAMPAFRVFIPAMQRRRRSMYQRLKDLLVRKGLSVSGDA
jgi:hypothetical protein